MGFDHTDKAQETKNARTPGVVGITLKQAMRADEWEQRDRVTGCSDDVTSIGDVHAYLPEKPWWNASFGGGWWPKTLPALCTP